MMKNHDSNKNSNKIPRRKFLRGASLSAAAFSIVPRHVIGKGYQAPSDTVNVAAIGAGGMGASNMSRLTSQNIVALADCDYNRVRESVARDNRQELREAYDKAKWYHDFREMLDKQKDIDALVIATPDHVHASAANLAMKMGKHVYVQKPLTYTVHEARTLRQTAKETGVVTQMGNQGHSSDDARKVNEWVQAGAIGTVREVHVWTNRPVWPQGIDRPTEKVKVPKELDWDVFLGPAPYVDYHPAYHPFSWRGWTDYGVGALGDMGAHLVDHPYWALGLDYPATVEASSTPWGGKDDEKASYPLSTTVHYTFPSRGMLPEVHMHWYDGGIMPPRPAVLPDEVKLDKGGGVIFVGEKGILMHKTYGSDPQMYPQSLMAEYADTPQKYKRITTSHEMNWIEAIQGKAEATSPFDYAAPLTETMLLGVVALHAPGQTLRYNSDKMEFTNNMEVNRHLKRDYREGWVL